MFLSWHPGLLTVLLLLDLLVGIDELVGLGDKFVDDIRAGTHQQTGWPNSMYGGSQAVDLLSCSQAETAILQAACTCSVTQLAAVCCVGCSVPAAAPTYRDALAAGWFPSLYAGISKCLENSYTRLLAEQMKESGIMVNACCPG